MTVLLIVDIHIQNQMITSVSVMALTRGIHWMRLFYNEIARCWPTLKYQNYIQNIRRD